MTVLQLIASLLLISVGAELLVRGASLLARRWGVSPLFIGLTIVGFGTSTPELGASLVATLNGATDVAVGNVIGSNLFNIAVILGLTAVVYPITVHFAALRRDLLVAIATCFVPWVAPLTGDVLSRIAGVVLAALLLSYLVISYRSSRRSSPADQQLAQEEIGKTFASAKSSRRNTVWFHGLTVVLGLAGLIGGSTLFVDSAIALARSWGISELTIGLTIVAAGTSLPELITSLVAAWRGSPDIAIGNVLGSNIFNMLGILGVSAIVAPQQISRTVQMQDTPILLLLSLLLIPFVRTGRRVSRTEGIILLLAYGAYMVLVLQRP